MNIIYGKNPIMEQIADNPGQIDKIMLSKTIQRSKIEELLNLCKVNHIRFDFLPIEKLDQLAKGAVHQGMIASVSDYQYQELENLDLDGKSTVVVLDLIEDPQNLGAIIRSSAASGAKAVIIQDRNCAQVNETVIKVSAGTTGKIAVVKVTNITKTLEKLKDMGFWVVGTDMDQATDYRSFEYPEKCVIVIGNEGKGMRPLVKKNCDYIVKIPLKNGVESLNASVAAALLLFRAID